MNHIYRRSYFQCIGAVLGISMSLFYYVTGYMSIYSSIIRDFNYIGVFRIIPSIFLVPLCLLLCLLSLTTYLYSEKHGLNESYKKLKTFNSKLVVLTLIVGFMGCKFSFILPSIIILLDDILNYLSDKKVFEKEDLKENDEASYVNDKLNDEYSYINDLNDFDFENLSRVNDLYSRLDEIRLKDASDKEYREFKLLVNKLDIIRDLLSKNSDISFICEITGFEKDEVDFLAENYFKVLSVD